MNYPSIRIEGAILSPDILDRLEDLHGQRPADFGIVSPAKVKDEIARAWADAQDYWRIYQRKIETLRPESLATTETRNLWIVPLLGLLGYQLEYQHQGPRHGDKVYPLSHRTTNRALASLHITGYCDPAGLDRKPERAAGPRMSAHAMVQEYLNLTDQLYAIVTNGRLLRLLRDSSRLVKLTYLEFDLDRIFTDGLFADFAVLYRLLHATRMPVSPEAAAESLIERYHQDSIDSGARIRDGLSRAVEDAILAFANGLLALVGIQGPRWIFDQQWAMPSMIIMSVWGAGGSMLIFLAGLQSIPTTLYEAAKIDGANAWHRFWHVTIPLLTPTIFFSIVMRVIGSWQVFTQAYVMTGGGPNNATLTVVLYIYRKAFELFRFGYSSAIAWVLFSIILVFTLMIIRSSTAWVYYEGELKK